jgi:DNA-binding winged helix-turn-helix (wHTH) protein/TolB-like protein
LCDNAEPLVTQGCFRFGLFELAGDGLDLRRDGRTVHLQAQPKQVLVYLVKNSDRTVSRDELRKTIWGNETFVDFERGLNFCISQIRSALRDDAASPTYIRTFARQGYRFIAPVEWIPVASVAPVQPAIPATPARRALMVGVAVALLSAVVLAGGILLKKSRTSKPMPIVAVVRFDNETGEMATTRFSDGLTDVVVERLTSLSNGRYGVIGNAQVLRGPRDQRNLTAIAASLRASYIVLGQIQSDGSQTRILAHLIHMPEQTHVWVVRLDHGALANSLDLEAEAAQKIATQFAIPLASGDASPFREKH